MHDRYISEILLIPKTYLSRLKLYKSILQLQDVVDRYQRPAGPSLGDFGDVLNTENTNNGGAAAVQPSGGFVVKGGPWEQRAPDTASTHEFPTMPGAPRAAANPTPSSAWGPRR